MITLDFKIRGIDKLHAGLLGLVDIEGREIKRGLHKSLWKVGRESKRRTPVDTGRLRSSIGARGSDGIFKIREGYGEIGTTVPYAEIQHEAHYQHDIGERKYMAKGLNASQRYIRRTMADALEKRIDNKT